MKNIHNQIEQLSAINPNDTPEGIFPSLSFSTPQQFNLLILPALLLIAWFIGRT